MSNAFTRTLLGGDEFSTILMDPPWPEFGGGKIKRGADKHYPLIKTESEMFEVISRASVWRPAENAHMWMWVTDNYIAWAVRLYPALGFTMHRMIPWRTKPGLGQYMQSCHTHLAFGTRGRGKEVLKKRMRTDYLWDAKNPTGEHSRKPDEQYELIMQMSKGPYLEMFARPRDDADSHEGWTYWGNEV